MHSDHCTQEFEITDKTTNTINNLITHHDNYHQFLPQRINTHDYFMKLAQVSAERSTCARIQTAAVITLDKHVVSTGYNGTANGKTHCQDHWIEQFKQERKTKSVTETITDSIQLQKEWQDYIKSETFSTNHHAWSRINEFHGEQNAILWAARHGVSTLNTTMYTVYSPCLDCAKLIVGAGISKVYYKYTYKRDTSGIDLLKNHNIIIKSL